MLRPRMSRQCCLCKFHNNTMKHASLVVVPPVEPPYKPWKLAWTRTTPPPKRLMLAGAMAAGAGAPRRPRASPEASPDPAAPNSDVGGAEESWQPRRRSYHCKTCGRAFRYACNLRAHEASHARAPVAAFSCPECRAAFPQAHQLTDHIREHAVLQQQVQMQEQMARQMEEQMMLQQQLEEQFMIQQAYITQTAFGASLGLGWGAAAAPTPIRCVCLECGREFLQRSALRQHMREHERRSRQRNRSPRHARRSARTATAPRSLSPSPPCPSARSNGKPPVNGDVTPSPSPAFFRCGCGAGFDDPQSLHAHRAVHVRKKPFHCSQCPADFSNPWNLARHYKEHLRHLCVMSLSDLRCNVCNENFRSNELELRRHRALHKDVRFCRCGRCGATFRSGWDWESHVATCDRPVAA